MTKQPENVELEANKIYFWCSCGLSANQPFCDGAHKGSEMKSIPFKVEASTSAWLCTCKKTKNPPYCDGSHKE